jgi:uncharacterized membrane protein
MIDVILVAKFVHLVGAALMLGTWLGVAAFFVFAHRSGNVSVIALVSQFVVRIELFIVAVAMVLQPISGFALGAVVGLSPADNFWIDISLAVYGAVAACWLGAAGIEWRVKKIARVAALDRVPLGTAYQRLFRIWLALAVIIISGMVALFVVMVWQPRLD